MKVKAKYVSYPHYVDVIGGVTVKIGEGYYRYVETFDYDTVSDWEYLLVWCDK